MAVKWTKLQKYTNSFHDKDPPKFTQIWIFGLKICHLATLPECPIGEKDIFRNLTFFISNRKVFRSQSKLSQLHFIYFFHPLNKIL
jgi:hypothetical protein